MSRWGAILAVGLLAGCGYSHIAETRTTFQRQGAGLKLTVFRHLDTVLRGPDIEEDQRLILELKDFTIGQQLAVPSEFVRARFDIDRFGPSSQGSEFQGYVIVKSVTDKQAVVNLQLNVTARTTTGSHVQRVKFRGDHTFTRLGRDD